MEMHYTTNPYKEILCTLAYNSKKLNDSCRQGWEITLPKILRNLEQTFRCLIVPRTRVKIGAFYGLLAILSPSNDIKGTFIDSRSK